MNYLNNKQKHIINKCFFSILIIYLFTSITGCSSIKVQQIENIINTSNVNLVWPPPPQTPRIKYIGSITGNIDNEETRTWVQKTFNIFAGKEDSSTILFRPFGIFSANKKIFISDTGAQAVHVFDTETNTYFPITKIGEEFLVSPIGITADTQGLLYITDSVLRKVFVFDEKGNFLKVFCQSCEFLRPTGIVFYNNKIYIVDTLEHKIKVFDARNESFIFSFGERGSSKGMFNYPTSIFVNKLGNIYITDSLNFRVQIFDSNGNFLHLFGKHGDGTGDFSKPKGIAVDSEGHIYVADAEFDNVQIFNSEGRLLLTFGKSGKKEGDFSIPAGLFIDENDQIYVADTFNSRIQVFQYIK